MSILEWLTWTVEEFLNTPTTLPTWKWIVCTCILMFGAVWIDGGSFNKWATKKLSFEKEANE